MPRTRKRVTKDTEILYNRGTVTFKSIAICDEAHRHPADIPPSIMGKKRFQGPKLTINQVQLRRIDSIYPMSYNM